jgi:hypothetical protein
MAFEIRVGRSEDLEVSSEFIRTARAYSENKDLIEALRAVSGSPVELIPNIPGFSEEAIALLQTDAGHGILDTWLYTFKETLNLIDQYDATGHYKPEELTSIAETQQRVIDALGQRAAQLVATIGTDSPLVEQGRAERSALIEMKGQGR